MSLTTTFLCGFAGSAAVEIATLHQIYQEWTPETKGLPARYKRIGFWVTRFLLALAGGGLALAYEIDKPILAINIGASAPLIIGALGRGYKNTTLPPQA